jgi:hypothetical protein
MQNINWKKNPSPAENYFTDNKFDPKKIDAIRHPIKPAHIGTPVSFGLFDSVEFWYTIVVTLSEMTLVIDNRINMKIILLSFD